MVIYVPGTEETDPKKQNMSLQQLAAAATTLQGYAPASGQFAFPATQNSSSNPNVLDDYEEGTWTPVLTFVTPGNLSVVYALQNGYYTKVGRLVSISFAIVTSTFTHTTASGNLRVTGLPFTAVNDANYRSYAPVLFQGITKAGYSSVLSEMNGNTSFFNFPASGSGVAVSNVVPADTPSGGTVIVAGAANYVV